MRRTAAAALMLAVAACSHPAPPTPPVPPAAAVPTIEDAPDAPAPHFRRHKPPTRAKVDQALSRILDALRNYRDAGNPTKGP